MLSNDAVQHLERLAKTTDQLRLGMTVQRQQVEHAREAGASWASIGAVMGMTRQAARQRYAPTPAGQTFERLF